MEANIGRNLAKVLTESAVLVVSGFEPAPRPGVFAVLDLHQKDVPLIGWELTGVPDSERRLLLLLRDPYPLCTLPFFLVHT